MPTAASETAGLAPWRPGMWRWCLPSLRGVVAGVADRSADYQALARLLAPRRGFVQAQQVHGASTANLLGAVAGDLVVPGCDALLTSTPAMALAVRSADCLPIIVWDPVRRVAGALHAGWRGLEKGLPMRVVALMAHAFGARASETWVAIGPAIRSCCYEVGPEFEARFPAFVSIRDGRRICDLVACAVHQLLQAGLPARRIVDSGVCTACDTSRWFSVRKDGSGTGRLLSFIMIER